MTNLPSELPAHPEPLITIGIVADTHVPDRVSSLHPHILTLLEQARVAHILHAGDICTNRVLDELRQIAPVTAVRGNRDIFAGPLSMVQTLEFGGVPVALTHGHGGWIKYLMDKVFFIRDGYQFDRYISFLIKTAQEARVVVFGHTHYPEMEWVSGKLLFNPGSASFGPMPGNLPNIGLLQIYADGEVSGKMIPLAGYIIKNRKWVEKV